jgi:hypothetical protein
MRERRHPLCDFTPQQVQARKEAAKHAAAPAEVKAHVSGGNKPATPSPQTSIPAAPAAPQSQAGAEIKPDLAKSKREGRAGRRRHRRHVRYR